jgi:hypothetical protein
MDFGQLKIPGAAALVLDTETVDRILALRDGDAALLYLFLLRKNGSADGNALSDALGWSGERTQRAFSLLNRAGFLGGAAEVAKPAATVMEDNPPDYSAEEITQELKSGSSFPALVEDVENRLGRLLSNIDLKILYGLYDHLSLPPEVISLLVTYCIEDCQRQSGPGRMPRLRQIEKEAYSWHRQGADTVERADQHLKALSRRRSSQGQILSALGISGRSPVPSERRYIDEWLDMGFGPEAVSIAYDRTVLKTGGLKWPYMNSILKSWHQKGLHTPDEIEAGDSAPAVKGGRPADDGASDREAIAWMQEYLQNKRRKDRN